MQAVCSLPSRHYITNSKANSSDISAPFNSGGSFIGLKSIESAALDFQKHGENRYYGNSAAIREEQNGTFNFIDVFISSTLLMFLLSFSQLF